MDLRIFTEPQQGASHADLLAVAQATRANGFSAFFRSDHVLAMGDRSGLPGPSDSYVNLGAIAAARAGHPARHPGHLGDLPASVDDGHRGRPARRHLRRQNGTRHRQWVVRGRAQRLRAGLRRVLRRAFRSADRATGDHHRAVGNADRRDVRPCRVALHPGRRAWFAQTRPAGRAGPAPGTDHHRRPRPAPDTGAGGALRRRVQRRLLRPARSARPNSAGSGPPARTPDGTPIRWSTRWRTHSASARPRPNSSAERRPSGAIRRRSARAARSPARSPR